MILGTTAVIDTRQDTKFTPWTAGLDQVSSLVSDISKAGIWFQVCSQQYADASLSEK